MSSNQVSETTDQSFEPESMGEPSSLARAFDRPTAGSAPSGKGRALRGRRAGREAWTGTTEGRSLATFLGWFSVGLGLVELLAPRAAQPPSQETVH